MPADASMRPSSRIVSIAPFVQKEIPGHLDQMAEGLLKALLFMAIALGVTIYIYYLITILLNYAGDISKWMTFQFP